MSKESENQNKNLDKVSDSLEEKELSGQNLDELKSKIKNSAQASRIVVNKADIDTICKEFELERGQAVNYYKLNNGNLKDTLKYILQN